ncbi:MAG TPA: sigma-70 family RNA polymerase sigma factor, partial [Verrucomicrobiota bacterium]|nr:sigma-70 family RNA polymerase sigma factor [Verrucomicrobiota bacterium]
MDAASDSAALLREFAESRSEAAFAALVSRHLGLVYATALRRDGRPALAEEACQLVFIDLARKAARVPSTMPLAGWLHRHACHVTAGLLRTEARRSRREELAMQHRHSAEDIDWSRLAAVLDEALLALPDADRAALVLRFLEQRPLAEVGAALCVTENAARMRVDRALDRLRDRLSRRGITSTASALAAVFAGPAVAGPPPALAATVTSAALAAGGAAASTFGLLSLMASTKLKAAAVAALILSAGTALVLEHRAARRQRDENAALLGRLAALSAEAEAARRAASAA